MSVPSHSFPEDQKSVEELLNFARCALEAAQKPEAAPKERLGVRV